MWPSCAFDCEAREKIQPLDPLTADELNALANDPGTPGSRADELAAAVVEEDVADDSAFVSSDEDELELETERSKSG